MKPKQHKKPKRRPKIVYTHTLPIPIRINPNDEHLKVYDALSVLLHSTQRTYTSASNKTRKLIYTELSNRKISWQTETTLSTYDPNGLSKLYDYSDSSMCAMVVKWIQSGRISKESMLEKFDIQPYGECEDDDYHINMKIGIALIHEIYRVKNYHKIKTLIENLASLCYYTIHHFGKPDSIDWYSFIRYGWIYKCGLFTFTKKIIVVGTIMQHAIREMVKSNDVEFHWS